MEIYKSRFTPGLQTAEDVKLEIGEVVKIRFSDNTECNAIVKSGRVQHRETPELGYEFESEGEIFFTKARNVIWWEGKDELKNEEDVTVKS